MAAKLQSSRLKLNRAMNHIESLEQSVADYFNDNWYSVTTNGDPHNLHVNISIHGTPKDFAVIVGDALHNLRAALDVLAVDVVRANGGATKNVYFPFTKDAASLEDTIKSRFSGASSAAQAKIRSLKPFEAGNPELRALHDLDIQDKHLELIPHWAVITSPSIGVKTDANGEPVGFAEGKLEIEVSTEPPKIVHTFPDNGPAAGKKVLETLRSLHDAVTTIVNDFEAII